MKNKEVNEVLRRPSWARFSPFEKVGFSMLFLFFAFMLYLFFIAPRF